MFCGAKSRIFNKGTVLDLVWKYACNMPVHVAVVYLYPNNKLLFTTNCSSVSNENVEVFGNVACKSLRIVQKSICLHQLSLQNQTGLDKTKHSCEGKPGTMYQVKSDAHKLITQAQIQTHGKIDTDKIHLYTQMKLKKRTYMYYSKTEHMTQ